MLPVVGVFADKIKAHTLEEIQQDPELYAFAIAGGKTMFKENCAACHGNDGKGNRELGAPNLADAIWLYGGEKVSVAVQITNPRHRVMPTWESRLPDEIIKQLTIYVHLLGGGEGGVAAAPVTAEAAAAEPTDVDTHEMV